MAESTNGTADFVPVIEVEELRSRVDANKVFLLDVRGSAHGGQIYGAIRYDPHKLKAAARLILPLPKDGTPVVLYDEDGQSRSLRELADKLLQNGFESVRMLAGGFAAWKAADGKTEEPTLEQPVPMVSEHQVER